MCWQKTVPLLVELEMTFALVWISFCYRWPLFCHFLSSILHSSLSWLYPSPFFLCLSHFSLSLSLLNAPPTSFSASLCKFGSSSYGNNFYVTRWVKCNIFKVKCLCLHTHTQKLWLFSDFFSCHLLQHSLYCFTIVIGDTDGSLFPWWIASLRSEKRDWNCDLLHRIDYCPLTSFFIPSHSFSIFE